MREVIEETTQGTLGAVDVGVANLWPRAWPGEGAAEQLTARVAWLVEGQQRWELVAVGTTLEIGGLRWRVEAIDKAPAALGRVTFVRE